MASDFNRDQCQADSSLLSSWGRTSRRRFLAGITASGVVLSSGAVLAQESASTIELGGEVPGWVGRSPSEIQDKTNPTLNLEEGKTYELTWENLDGQPHNIVINDSNGNQLKRTELISEQGATQTLRFTATTEMAKYLCEVHPSTMVGDVSVSTGGMGAQSPAGNESQPEPAGNESQPEPAETPEQTFRLIFENDSWIGQSPTEIEGQTNPTLHLVKDKTYRISWENRKSISTPADQRPNLVVGAEYPDGNSVVHTQYLSESGATQSADFVATDDLSIYYAEAYPSARGEVSISDGTDSSQPEGGNGKAKQGNGKAKQGNGKAKQGNGKKTE